MGRPRGAGTLRKEVDLADDLERRHRDEGLLGDLDGAQLRRRLDRGVADREEDRPQVDLGVLGAHRLGPRAPIVHRHVRHDDVRLLGAIEDVRNATLVSTDGAPHDVRVCVQGDLDELIGGLSEHGRKDTLWRGPRGAATGPIGTIVWRPQSPGAQRPTGGPRRAARPSSGCRSQRATCPDGAERCVESAGRSQTGAGPNA